MKSRLKLLPLLGVAIVGACSSTNETSPSSNVGTDDSAGSTDDTGTKAKDAGTASNKVVAKKISDATDANGVRDVEYVLAQPLSHKKALTKNTVDQRVFVRYPKGSTKSSPIVLAIEGESTATPQRLELNAKSAWTALDAVIVYPEHRGYGKSVSHDEDQSLPTYVSVAEAVEDLHEDHAFIRKTLALTGPIVSYGGSYPGALALEYSRTYPSDVDVVVASCAPTTWLPVLDAHAVALKARVSPEAYANFAKHVSSLEPKSLFHQNWQDREFLEVALEGFVQYKAYAGYTSVLEGAAGGTTSALLNTLHSLDDSGGGEGRQYAVSRSATSLSRDEVMEGKSSWRVFFYQQCTGLGVFMGAKAAGQGVFPRQVGDFEAECKAMFGTYTPAGTWDLNGAPAEIAAGGSKVVLFGGKMDPWMSISIPKPDGSGTKDGAVEWFDTAYGAYGWNEGGYHGDEFSDPVLAKSLFTRAKTLLPTQ